MTPQTMNSPGPYRASAEIALWRLVADALENERALDVKYRASSTALPPSGLVPNFKVMKQLALKAQWGWAYPLLIAVAPIAVLLAVSWQWLLLLLSAFSGPRVKPPAKACWVLATSEDNRTIINAALDSDPHTATLPRHQIQFNIRAMGAKIGWVGCISAMHAHLRWLVHALTRPAGERRDLLLHGYDALALLGLVLLARQTKGIFVTDDHYQRWAHVLSYSVEDFRIVQHGFLDEELVLPHRGGSVSFLYLRDIMFRPSFMRYYNVVEHGLFSPPANFVQTPISNVALLLASSFPSIDEEIRLMTALRATCDAVPIIVKFHPAHRYDSRRGRLAALSTVVYEGVGNPACRIFVSYGSFMEFDYRRHGVATVSIARSGSVHAALQEIKSIIANSAPFQASCLSTAQPLSKLFPE